MTREQKGTERVKEVPDSFIAARHNNPMSAQTAQEALLVRRPDLAIAHECELGSYFLHVRSQISRHATCDICRTVFAFDGTLHVGERGMTVLQEIMSER